MTCRADGFFFSSLKPAPHQLPVCDPQPGMSASELMGCLSDDLLPSSLREGQLELLSKLQMVLVFAFLGSQLVLEHALACLAINGGNKMRGQGGVDVVGTMSSYAGCREISEFSSKTSFSPFLPNLIAASSKWREHECVAQTEYTPLEVGCDTEDRNVP